MDDLPLTIAGADEALDQELSARLSAFNAEASGGGAPQELTVRADDEAGLVAGLSGWTWGDSAGIALLWVREEARRAGWGGRLLAAAEREAAARGARAITVSSFTFQAPDFYRRHGYVETTRVPDLPFAGHADVWFTRPLTGGERGSRAEDQRAGAACATVGNGS